MIKTKHKIMNEEQITNRYTATILPCNENVNSSKSKQYNRNQFAVNL